MSLGKLDYVKVGKHERTDLSTDNYSGWIVGLHEVDYFQEGDLFYGTDGNVYKIRPKPPDLGVSVVDSVKAEEKVGG